jgi:hypothetical protein
LAAGGKKISEKYPYYEWELESLLDVSVIGDPEKPLRHVSKSARKLSDALEVKGIEVSHLVTDKNKSKHPVAAVLHGT